MTSEFGDTVVLVAFTISELVSSPITLGVVDMELPGSDSVFSPRADLALSGVAIDWVVIVATSAVVLAVDLNSRVVVMLEDGALGVSEAVIDLVVASSVMVD